MKKGAAAAAASSARGARAGVGEVRIISGIWKRTRLRVLSRPGLRPTPDRVRETIFNWLGSDLSGWRVLDAFAGAGALGLEAASRGADEVVLLDNDGDVVRELRATHQRLQAPPSVQVVRADAMDWMARSPAGRFELVFIDPPFGAEMAAAAAALAARLLVPGGWMVVESPNPLAAAEPGPTGACAPRLVTHRQLRAGAVWVELQQLPDNPE